MKTKTATVLVILMLICLTQSTVFANVFASGLAANTAKINPSLGQSVELSYRLNEPADQGVTVKIYDGANLAIRTLTGGTAKGLNKVVWDGKTDNGSAAPAGNYYFVVTAADDGHAKWEKISLDEPGNTIYSPKGIDVNKNFASPNYGLVYLTNSAKGKSANPGAVMQYDGVYSYYADATPVAQYVDSTIWNKKSGNSPFRLSVGTDENIYIADYSDGWENIYMLNGALQTSSLVQIMARDDADGATPPAGNHGSVLTAICRGIAADRVMYTTDEDFDSYDVWKYAIGIGPFPYTAVGTKLISEAPAMTDVWDFDMDKSGKFVYACDDQDAANPLNPAPPPSFSKWDISATPAQAVWSTPTTAIVHNVDGVAYDELHDIVAGGTRTTHPYIYIINATTGALKDTVINPGGGRNRDVAFDYVGNLYVVNSTNEYWRVFSPPDGANTSSTQASFIIEVATAVENKNTEVVKDFTLYNCYPNPFNPSTTISFYLPGSEYVTLAVMNMRGERVRQLISQRMAAGTHSLAWSGTDDAGRLLPSGVYFCQIKAGAFAQQKKMILAK